MSLESKEQFTKKTYFLKKFSDILKVKILKKRNNISHKQKLMRILSDINSATIPLVHFNFLGSAREIRKIKKEEM